MIRLDPADVRRIAVSTVAALLLSAACVAGAIAPAAAADSTAPCEPLSAIAWQTEVGTRLDARLAVPVAALSGHDRLVAAIDVAFDRDGRFAGAAIARGSGIRAIDAEVLRIAGDLAYPPLPAAYRGQERTVTMIAYFDADAAPVPGASRAADPLLSSPA